MGKSVFLAVFFAALMTASVAQDLTEQSYRDVMCRREVQQKPLNACQQILQDKLTGGRREGAASVPLLRAEWDTRERCCRQLQSVSRGCRCSAIRGMVRDYEETMPALGGGRRGPWEQQEQGHCSGETAGHHQQGGGYHGEEGRGQQGQVLRHDMPPRQQDYYGGETAESQQQGGVSYGERPQQQHGEGLYSETSTRHGGQEIYGEGAQQMQHVVRVRLMQVRQYVAGLPTVCQVEPMECSVFSGGQY